MSRILVIFILMSLSILARAANSTPAPSAAALKDKSKPVARSANVFACRGKELAQRDCLLQINKAKIQVWHDKIIYTDPVTSATETVPEQSADVTWHSLSTLHLASRWFLVLTFWSEPEANTGIETLRWFVFEIAGGHVPLKVQKSVQKRVKNSTGRWRTDQMISHQLNINKSGKIFASFGRETIPLN